MYFYDVYPEKSFPMSPREHVRRRPGMYVGGTGERALHHLVYQILDHMVEEAFVGRCNHIWIEIQENNKVVLRDNSQGLPTALYRDTDFSWMEVLLQDIGNSKSKFEPDAYQITGGLHGLGFATINVLSDYFRVENYHDGTLWRQTYHQGIPTTPVVKIRDTRTESIHGTHIHFQPDFTIFDKIELNIEKILKRAKDVAMFTPRLTVEVSDTRSNLVSNKVFYYPDGLKAWIIQQNISNEGLHDLIHLQEDIILTRADGSKIAFGLEIAFQFSSGKNGKICSYVNTVETPEGTHITAFKSALLSCINEYVAQDIDNHREYTWQDISDKVSAIISVRHAEPQFVSPTKINLGNTEIYGPIAGVVYSSFSSAWSWDNRKVIKRIVDNLNVD